MADFQVHKTTALPAVGQRTAHSIYYVAPPGQAEHFETYITGADPANIKRAFTRDDIISIIAEELAGVSKPISVLEFADLPHPATDIPPATIAYVADASGDPTVNSGAALYVFFVNGSTRRWDKVAEFESMDVAVTTNWENLGGRPNSAPSAIDAAVANSHTHSNKTQLDKIGEANGSMTYGGAAVKTAWAATDW